jgi:ABC-type lipoprotein export system ATPase subunit
MIFLHKNRRIGLVFLFFNLLPNARYGRFLLPSLPLNINDGSVEAKGRMLIKANRNLGTAFSITIISLRRECQRTECKSFDKKPSNNTADETTGALDHSNEVKLVDTIY